VLEPCGRDSRGWAVRERMETVIVRARPGKDGLQGLASHSGADTTEVSLFVPDSQLCAGPVPSPRLAGHNKPHTPSERQSGTTSLSLSDQTRIVVEPASRILRQEKHPANNQPGLQLSLSHAELTNSTRSSLCVDQCKPRTSPNSSRNHSLDANRVQIGNLTQQQTFGKTS